MGIGPHRIDPCPLCSVPRWFAARDSGTERGGEFPIPCGRVVYAVNHRRTTGQKGHLTGGDPTGPLPSNAGRADAWTEPHGVTGLHIRARAALATS